MYIPSQEQWQKVIDTFETVLPIAPSEEHFDMASDCTCGTTCCVAGWYELAKARIDNREPHDNWLSGKQAIAVDLGFEDGNAFREWARQNPMLWGNELGDLMFVLVETYDCGQPDAYAETLLDVINHFKFVKQQCYAYANESPMADGN